MKYKLVLILITPLILQSCVVFKPVVVDNPKGQDECVVVTKKMELEPSTIGSLESCGGLECLAVPLISSAATIIVSGSIVLANNSLHWAEYSGKCGFSTKLEQGNSAKDCIQSCDLETGECSCLIAR